MSLIDGNGRKVKPPKHPVREILDAGGIVDGETFDRMLKEESETAYLSELEEINKNVREMNKNLYVQLNLISKSHQASDSKMLEVYKTLQFKNHDNYLSALKYDDKTQEILIDEDSLMRAIMIANEYQVPRKLKLISRDEMKSKRFNK